MEDYRHAVNAKYGYNLQDYWQLHHWTTHKHAEFMEFVR